MPDLTPWHYCVIALSMLAFGVLVLLIAEITSGAELGQVGLAVASLALLLGLIADALWGWGSKQR